LNLNVGGLKLYNTKVSGSEDTIVLRIMETLF